MGNVIYRCHVSLFRMTKVSLDYRTKAQALGFNEEDANQRPAFDVKQNLNIKQKMIFFKMVRSSVYIFCISENHFNFSALKKYI